MARGVADALLDAGAAEVFAVGGALDDLGLVTVDDEWPGEGPLGAILTSFDAAAESVVMIVACDIAFVTAEVIRTVVAGLERSPAAGASIARTDRRQPLCGAYRVERCRTPMRQAFDQGARAVVDVLGAVDCVDVSVPADALRNVNRRADLSGG